MSRARDWWVVAACLGCQIGMGVGGYIFPVFLKPVVDELGWSRADYAVANPIMSTVVALVGPLVGSISDRRGPRIVLAAGASIMAGGLLTAGGMQSKLDFYAMAFLVGVGVACLGDLPTGTAIAGRFQRRLGLALGIVYIGSNIGGALIPLVATALAAAASWRYAFRSVAVVLFIVLLPLSLSVSKVSSNGEPEREPETAADRGPVREAISQRDFWLLFFVLFAFYFYRLGVNVHLVAHLSDLGYSSFEAASRYSLTLALGIAGKLVAGSVADRIGAKTAVVGNFVIIAVASALLLAPPLPGVIPLFLVVHGFSTAAEDVVIPLIVGQRFGIENLGRVYGVLLLALIPGGSFGPLLAGRVFDVTGSYESVFGIFLAGNVLAVFALAVVRGRSS
jgi:MFS family permease